MADFAMECMGNEPQVLRARLGAFVRAKASSKALARLIGCDLRTAENIRLDHWPGDRLWARLYEIFGDEVLDAVFRPNLHATRIEQECRELERQLEEKRLVARSLQAGDGSPAAAQAARHAPQVRS